MIRKSKRSLLFRFFHARKVIVVTDKSVDYYPIGVFTQIAAFVSVIGFASWVSYSTGSYMAAESMLREKDRTIAAVSTENRKIESQFSMLKEDLVRIQQQETQELSDYTRFVIDQYASDSMAGIRSLTQTGVQMADNQGMMIERLNFMEERIEQLKREKEEFVNAVRRRTDGRINDFEQIIATTGVPVEALEERAMIEPPLVAPAHAEIATDNDIFTASDEDERGNERLLPRGGPFVPFESSSVEEQEPELFASLDRMLGLHDILRDMPLEQPLPNNPRMTSGFGQRIDPFSKRLAVHQGIDLAGPYGAKVRATNDGVVTYTGYKGAYGQIVEIKHKMGLSTRYGHLSKFLVKPGQKIKKGQVIAIQGSTGRSTGHHVHYEVRYDGKPLNPMKFVRAGKKYIATLSE